MTVTCRLVGVRCCFGPVQHQRPLLEQPCLDVGPDAHDGLHDDVQGPRPAGQLGPGVGRHEGPAGEAVLVVVVVGTLAQDHGAVGHTRVIQGSYRGQTRQGVRQVEQVV